MATPENTMHRTRLIECCDKAAEDNKRIHILAALLSDDSEFVRKSGATKLAEIDQLPQDVIQPIISAILNTNIPSDNSALIKALAACNPDEIKVIVPVAWCLGSRDRSVVMSTLNSINAMGGSNYLQVPLAVKFNVPCSDFDALMENKAEIKDRSPDSIIKNLKYIAVKSTDEISQADLNKILTSLHATRNTKVFGEALWTLGNVAHKLSPEQSKASFASLVYEAHRAAHCKQDIQREYFFCAREINHKDAALASVIDQFHIPRNKIREIERSVTKAYVHGMNPQPDIILAVVDMARELPDYAEIVVDQLGHMLQKFGEEAGSLISSELLTMYQDITDENIRIAVLRALSQARYNTHEISQKLEYILESEHDMPVEREKQCTISKLRNHAA